MWSDLWQQQEATSFNRLGKGERDMLHYSFQAHTV